MKIEKFLKMQELDFSDESIENQLHIVEEYSGKTNLSAVDFFNEIKNIGDEVSNFKAKFSKTVNLNGKELKFHTINEMSAKQFIDFDNLSKQNNKENMTTLLSIIYTEDTDNYVDDVMNNKELIENYMSAEEALGAINFFALSSMKYLADTQISLVTEEMTEEMKTTYDQIQIAFQDYQNIMAGN